ncbi:hypothetical protein [Paenibacillus sabuli]|uniref:hypothetical protein n=1 Tax=Paenibacillus sabuli TaxID=2772509 RepID=UPI00295A57CC|nr:hypothetical protein [Paenibacillus sabuli]
MTKRGEPIPADTIVWMFHRELHNLQEVYAARKLIESEVYLSACGKLAPGDLDRLASYLDAVRDRARMTPEAALLQVPGALRSGSRARTEEAAARFFAASQSFYASLARD